MSTNADEFLVVDESEQGVDDALDQLRETVVLFNSSISALRESSVLLKDELQRALGAALERAGTSNTGTTEEILKEFNKSVKSNDDIRKDYLKRICARLVTTENEKQKLEAEYNSLKASQYISFANMENTQEHENELIEMSKTIDQIERKMEELGVSNSKTDEKSQATMEPKLTVLHKRLENLNAKMTELIAMRRRRASSSTKNRKQTMDHSWYDIINKSETDNSPSTEKSAEQEKKCSKDKEAEGSTKGNPTQLEDLESRVEDVIVQTLTRVMSSMPGPWNGMPPAPSYNRVSLNADDKEGTGESAKATEESSKKKNNKSENSASGENKNKDESRAHYGSGPLPSPSWANYIPPMGPVNNFMPFRGPYFRPYFQGPLGPRGGMNARGMHRGGMNNMRWVRPGCPKNAPPGPRNNATDNKNSTQNADKQEPKEPQTPLWIPDFLFD